MAKEVLAIPEENLEEVVRVIRTGLECVGSSHYLPQISDETRVQLTKWCDDEEEYLKRIGAI